MRKSGLWCGITALVFGLLALPALAQFDGQPRFKMPANLSATDGEFILEWDDLRPGAVNPGLGLVSFTWYYAKAAAGAERTRITTILREDFTTFRNNWQAPGPFGFDWDVKANRRGRQFLQSPSRPGASPLISNFSIPPDSVVGLLVRPAGNRHEWAIELRYQGKNQSLEFRQDGNKLKILECGKPLPNVHIDLPGTREWLWYEIGLETRARRDVEIRIRVFNEDRTMLVSQFSRQVRLSEPKLREGGVIALSGPADFGELYVDPWSARWADDNTNKLRWDTSMVPNGDYVLIAEVCDGRRSLRQLATDFHISVRNPGQAAGR
jgi:hypothetical protein